MIDSAFDLRHDRTMRDINLRHQRWLVNHYAECWREDRKFFRGFVALVGIQVAIALFFVLSPVPDAMVLLPGTLAIHPIACSVKTWRVMRLHQDLERAARNQVADLEVPS